MATKPHKTSTKHPYAAIEHRVIDSPAYADLTFSARSLLTLLARQLTKDNNGYLQATYKFMKRYGFASEHTLSRSIGELIAHGFVYRTRSGGYQQGASQYAVTWLSITKRNDIFLDGFVPCAWRNWESAPNMQNGNSNPPKMQSINCKNGILPPAVHAKNAVSKGAKNADNELMPCRVSVSAVESALPDEQHGDETTDDPTARTRDDDHPAGAWDSVTGEFITAQPVRGKKTRLHDVGAVH